MFTVFRDKNRYVDSLRLIFETVHGNNLQLCTFAPLWLPWPMFKVTGEFQTIMKVFVFQFGIQVD